MVEKSNLDEQKKMVEATEKKNELLASIFKMVTSLVDLTSKQFTPALAQMEHSVELMIKMGQLLVNYLMSEYSAHGGNAETIAVLKDLLAQMNQKSQVKIMADNITAGNDANLKVE
jgi:lipopolysaccharide biosynthesis regulator YciM